MCFIQMLNKGYFVNVSLHVNLFPKYLVNNMFVNVLDSSDSTEYIT